MDKIAAIILAAGESRRLGQPKQLLPLGAGTLLTHTVRAAFDSACRPVVVVLGANAEACEKELAAFCVTIIPNPEWPRGIGSSIRAGIRAIQHDECNRAVAILVCDQPFLSAGILHRLAAALSPDRTIAAAEYAGTLGTPALFARLHFEELSRLPDDAGAKALFAAHPQAVARVPFPEGAVDIDTPTDWASLQ